MLDDVSLVFAAEGHQDQTAGHPVYEECARVTGQCDLQQVVGRKHRISTKYRGDEREGDHAVVRRSMAEVEHAQDTGDFLVAAHDVGDTNAGVEARERRADESDEHGRCQDDHEREASAAQHRVADLPDHVADGGAGRGGCGVSSTRAGDRAAVHEEVGSHVFDDVGDAALDGQGEEDRAANVALRVDCLTTERRDRLEADQEKNGDGALKDDVGEVVRKNHRSQTGVRVGEFGVGHAERDSEDRERNKSRELNRIDDDGRHRGSGNTSIGDQTYDRREDERSADLERLIEHDAELGQDEHEQRRGERDHDARVDPVVEVGYPADHKLRQPGELVVDTLLTLQERGLREVIGRTRARIGEYVREFRIRKRCQEGKNKDEQQTGDHVECGGRSAILLDDLGLERRPQERAGRDQRHGVDREPGHRQGSLHFGPWRGGHRGPPVRARI